MSAIQRVLLVSILFLNFSLISTASQGDDKLDYVLAPLQTEFHRSEISSKASAILILNANAIGTNSEEDLLATLRTALEADLRALSARTGDLVLIRIQYSGGMKPENDVVVRLKDQLNKLAIKCGYPESQISQEWTSTEWKSGSGALGSGLMDDPGEEKLVVNKVLVAAPLRTRISRLHAGMADVVIKLRRPFDARNLSLSESTEEAIRNAVRSMKMSSTRKLHFQVSSTNAGAETVEKLFSNRQPPAIPNDAPPLIKELLLKEREGFAKSPALKLAQELGFQEIGYSHTPNGGAPEQLLAKQAPNFELEGLDGRLVKWAEWRRDRPALITFWGVACGPCRLEALHLSRLHEKYGDRVAIIGVNAYDESNETILAYVNKERLKHQIVVGGNTVATSSFHVGAYPTTFWINRRGEVVRYAVGFENGEELEAELIDFLAEDR